MIIELKIWRIFFFTSSDMLIFLYQFSNSIKSERIKRCLWSISEQVNIDDHVLLSLVQCKLPNWILFQADCVVNVSCLFVLFFSRLAGLFLSLKMFRNCTLLLRRQPANYKWTLHHFSLLFWLHLLCWSCCITNPALSPLPTVALHLQGKLYQSMKHIFMLIQFFSF